MNNIITIEDFNLELKNEGVAFYFTTSDCNVCKVLFPKLKMLLKENFPRIKLFKIDCTKAVELSAQQNIFSVPTLVVFFDGKEFIRVSRNIGLSELYDRIERPYKMIFGEL